MPPHHRFHVLREEDRSQQVVPFPNGILEPWGKTTIQDDSRTRGPIANGARRFRCLANEFCMQTMRACRQTGAQTTTSHGTQLAVTHLIGMTSTLLAPVTVPLRIKKLHTVTLFRLATARQSRKFGIVSSIKSCFPPVFIFLYPDTEVRSP